MNNDSDQIGIDRSFLFNKNYYEISENFMCLFCEKLSINPKACSNCKSLACEYCIKQNTNCKKCKSILKCNIIQLSNRELSVLNEIKFRCPNLKLGCTETITYKEFLNHKINCKHLLKTEKKIVSLNKEINSLKSIDVKEKGIQVINIGNDVVNCPICKKTINRYDFTEHNNGKCFESILLISEKHLLKKPHLYPSNNLKIDSFPLDEISNDQSFFLTKKKLRNSTDLIDRDIKTNNSIDLNKNIETQLTNSLPNITKFPSSLSNVFGSFDSFRLNEYSVCSEIESNNEETRITEENHDILKWYNGLYEYIHKGNYNFTFYSMKRLAKDFIISIRLKKITNNKFVSLGFSKELIMSNNYVLGTSKNEWCIRGDGTVIEINCVENNLYKDKFALKSGDIIHIIRKDNNLEFEIDGKENNYNYIISSELYFLVTLCSVDDEVELLHN